MSRSTATHREHKAQSPTLPQTMRAAAIERFGGVDVLALRELPLPTLGADEVLMAVHTAGVGSWDAEIRSGWWPFEQPATFPLVLGSDGSGFIAAKGSNVDRFQIGDEVYGFAWDNSKGGFYAEYIALPADKVARVPEGLDLEQAGGAAVIGLTALQGLEDSLKLKKGEQLLIHGASGGVGSAALQFAKGLGARVVATVSGDDGLRLARELGADEVIDGKRVDLLEAIREVAENGFDAIFATVGDQLTSLQATLKPHGRLSYPNGVEPAPEKREGIRVATYDGMAGRRQFERLNTMIEKVGLKVQTTPFSLDEAGQAQEQAQNGHVLGKIVLRVRDS